LNEFQIVDNLERPGHPRPGLRVSDGAPGPGHPTLEADENLAKIQALSDQFEPLYQQVSEKLKTRT
jgi:hypothetical protein